ncbi:hypothetical protein ASPZODRAFT_137461 [Penicilliopsis zonata CBS 506.65]|uniref:Uncharacterized protein n=1 Tax=Penicilliopsis zonata CBS 506.65 TaxID=1073090 RepID=A0A1L9S4R8_9EURO|nr:hypothetical protein ASPZODRAFT_137461 [Penicilliopsis zonata CBS 506.65]OJJ42150.1 hypothetical protein ASPZODRAFT_137461 [Penicilliopsis zonata CBS 506.65]
MDEPRIRLTDPRAAAGDASFYSQHTFQIEYPDVGLQWLCDMPPKNVQQLRKLSMYIHPLYHAGPDNRDAPDSPSPPDSPDSPDSLERQTPANGPLWCDLLDKISTDATGLEQLTLYLGSEPLMDHWGPAVDINFVHALGQLGNPNLRSLQIAGFFPKEWPLYLQQRTGLTVWDAAGKQEGYLTRLREFQRMLHDQTL